MGPKATASPIRSGTSSTPSGSRSSSTSWDLRMKGAHWLRTTGCAEGGTGRFCGPQHAAGGLCRWGWGSLRQPCHTLPQTRACLSGQVCSVFFRLTMSTPNRRRLPYPRSRFSSNRRWIPSHRRRVPFKCCPIVCLSTELAAGGSGIMFGFNYPASCHKHRHSPSDFAILRHAIPYHNTPCHPTPYHATLLCAPPSQP